MCKIIEKTRGIRYNKSSIMVQKNLWDGDTYGKRILRITPFYG
ncbi:hypothetical protein [Clostridium beijerinckii]|nr:hypothetical protein [Clostridium beijerinckii]NOW07658.1 hypothetical protein [Clostridium beijerinckii]NYC04569.1 hypothetical protein [Clostridium beijerinckii]